MLQSSFREPLLVHRIVHNAFKTNPPDSECFEFDGKNKSDRKCQLLPNAALARSVHGAAGLGGNRNLWNFYLFVWIGRASYLSACLVHSGYIQFKWFAICNRSALLASFPCHLQSSDRSPVSKPVWSMRSRSNRWTPLSKLRLILFHLERSFKSALLRHLNYEKAQSSVRSWKDSIGKDLHCLRKELMRVSLKALAGFSTREAYDTVFTPLGSWFELLSCALRKKKTNAFLWIAQRSRTSEPQKKMSVRTAIG